MVTHIIQLNAHTFNHLSLVHNQLIGEQCNEQGQINAEYTQKIFNEISRGFSCKIDARNFSRYFE